MLYQDEAYPGQTLTCPARLMAIVKDPSCDDPVYQPVVQWAGERTHCDSVLFDEYNFVESNDINSYNVHSVESIDKPVFVVDCETHNHNKIIVAHEPNTWPNKFL